MINLKFLSVIEEIFDFEMYVAFAETLQIS